MSKNVIYVGAHSDDILSIAGTMCLLSENGYKVHEFCITRGEAGHGIDSEWAAKRSKEEENVCKIIGADLKFFDQEDGAVYADKAICEEIAKEFERLKPVAVFTTWALEKPDHAAVCQIASKALNLAGLNWTTELYMTKVDIQSYSYKPEMYINVSSVMDKVQAIADCYQCQDAQPFVVHTLQSKRNLGEEMFVDAAESVMYFTPPINERWNRECEVGRLIRGLRSKN